MEKLNMAWYYRTYSYGHKGRANGIGPTKDQEKENI